MTTQVQILDMLDLHIFVFEDITKSCFALKPKPSSLPVEEGPAEKAHNFENASGSGVSICYRILEYSPETMQPCHASGCSLAAILNLACPPPKADGFG